MLRKIRNSSLGSLGLALVLMACSSNPGSADGGSGGSTSAGTGGVAATGGTNASGGTAQTSGGQPSSGGASSTGGGLSGGGPSSGGSPEASGGSGPASGGAGSGGGNSGTGGAGDTCDPTLRKANRDATAAALDGLFVQKNLNLIDQYWADPYLQHNPIGQSGVAAFKSIMSSIVSSQSFSYTQHLTLADCELSVVHGTYSQTGVIFDMFRVKDGKLIEHWDSDSNQASTVGPDVGGDDTHDEAADSSANAAIVREFMEVFLIGGDRDTLEDYLGEFYFDHRSGAAAGPSSILPHLENITYEKVHHLIADGNYVFVLSEGKQGTAAYGFYDLFRVADGKIEERWDSKRPVPTSTASGLPIF